MIIVGPRGGGYMICRWAQVRVAVTIMIVVSVRVTVLITLETRAGVEVGVRNRLMISSGGLTLVF